MRAINQIQLLLRFALGVLMVTGAAILPDGNTTVLAQNKSNDKPAPKHIFSGAAPAHPYDVILARPTDQAMTISVLAYRERFAKVSYGTISGKLDLETRVVNLKPETPSEFVLNDLKPNTRYFYRLHLGEPGKKELIPEVERSFHTARAQGSSFTFTIQSDSHLDQNTRPGIYERTLANALASKPDFHFDLGDTFMTDKYGKKYTDASPQYYAQRYYLGQIAHSVPLFMALGNHDGERLDRYAGTDDCMPVWSCVMRKKLFPNPGQEGFFRVSMAEMKHIGRLDNYYAFEWGDALLIALDPFWATGRIGKNATSGNWGRTLGKEQYDWLTKILSESKATFKFVFLHHLVGGLDEHARGGSEAAALYEWGGKNKDNKDEFKTQRPGWAMPIHQLLVKYRVTAVFHGHDHFFAKQELDDVLYIMVPQPGHPGYDRLKNAEEYGYFRGVFLPPSGHIRVSVTPAKTTIDYVRTFLPSAETATKKNGEVSHTVTVNAKK